MHQQEIIQVIFLAYFLNNPGRHREGADARGEGLVAARGVQVTPAHGRTVPDCPVFPAAGDGVVVVQSIDGKLFGLEATNGNERWRYEREVPVLTLRGSSAPVIRCT